MIFGEDEYIRTTDLPVVAQEIYGEDICVSRLQDNTALPTEHDEVRSTQQELMDRLLGEMATLKKRLYELEERLGRLEKQED